MTELPERSVFRQLCLAAFAIVTACVRDPAGLPGLGAPTEHASPAALGSGEPFLVTGRGGTLLLSWLEPRDSGHELRFARLAGEAWSASRAIASSNRLFVNEADFPSILEMSDGRLVAHWLERSGPGRYAYDVWLAESDDEGATWSSPVRPHHDGTETEHGFVTLFETPAGLGAVWLDGRNYANADPRDPGPGAEMTVRFTTRPAGRAPLPETLVDDRACDCCQTDVALSAAGPVLVYRDRSPVEVRDIVIRRLIDGRWTDAAPVHRDGWVFPGCPVNGPAVAASGNRVVVAWFTAARDTAMVKAAFSDDAGASFGSPVRVDSGDPVGRVDVVLLADASAVVAWLERSAEGARVLARRVGASGSSSPATAVFESRAQRPGGFPRMAVVGDRLFLAWTQPGEPARIRVASLVNPLP